TWLHTNPKTNRLHRHPVRQVYQRMTISGNANGRIARVAEVADSVRAGTHRTSRPTVREGTILKESQGIPPSIKRNLRKKKSRIRSRLRLPGSVGRVSRGNLHNGQNFAVRNGMI